MVKSAKRDIHLKCMKKGSHDKWVEVTIRHIVVVEEKEEKANSFPSDSHCKTC